MAITDPAVIIVNDKYAHSLQLADTASSAANALTQALERSVYSPEQISVQWTSLPAPNLPEVPNAPTLPGASFSAPAPTPSALTGGMDDVRIDDFTLAPPPMDFGPTPELVIGQAPALPEVRDVALPDAPVVALPEAPQFLALTTHTFGGVNLHEDWLDKLDDIPELSVFEPAPFNYSPGARYASQLLDNLKATLSARIHGGTGIDAQVEQQIWDRARDRETQVALAREQEVLRSAEALGFALPSGVLAGQLADARREYHDKVSGLSRDIAIKQAELEQQNAKDAIQAALQLETTLLDDCHKLEMLAFEAAKAAADNALQAHNAAVERFKGLLAGYQAYASAYDTIIKAELNKVEVFKAMLAAEETKANINQSLVQRYKAEVEGAMAGVEIYKARVGAAQTLVELERTRIQAGAEQVKAFVATVNAETAKAELFKARVSAEGMKQEAYKSQVQAYASKTSAQVEKARLGVAKYQALISAKGLEWDGWKARLSAEVSKMDAATRQASIAYDGYRIAASASEARAGAISRIWEVGIKQYEASKSLAFNVAKANADAVTHANDARMEAAKVGLATASQRLASAWSMVSASAGVGSQMQYQYKM